MRALDLIHVVLRLVWGLALSAACAAAPPPVLTMAVANVPYAASALVADAQGYFAAEGVSVKLLPCTVGMVCLKKLLDGEAQFAAVADTPIMFASFARRDFVIVATMTTSGRENRLVVRQDRGIKTAAELKGKRVGILLGTASHYFTESFLLFNGMRLSDVTLVGLDPRDPTGALERGEVDAAALFGTKAHAVLRRLGARGLALPALPFYTVGYNMVTFPATAGVSDDDVFKVLRALQRANAMIHAEPEKARAVVAAATRSDVGTLAEIWDDFDFRLQLGQPLVTTLEAQARWAMREGLAPAGATIPDYLDMMRLQPLVRLDRRAVRLLK